MLQQSAEVSKTDPQQAVELLRPLMQWDLAFENADLENVFVYQYSPFLSVNSARALSVLGVLAALVMALYSWSTDLPLGFTLFYVIAAVICFCVLLPLTFTQWLCARDPTLRHYMFKSLTRYTNVLFSLSVGTSVARVLIISDNGLRSFMALGT